MIRRAAVAALLALLALAALALRTPAARAADAPALVGSWAMELAPAQVMVLRADGSGAFAGQEIRWAVRGDRLRVTDAAGAADENGFRLQGDSLVVIGAGGLQVGFRRVAGAPRGGAAGRAPGGAAGGAPAPGGTELDGKIRQLLLSSAWCSFTYKAIPGGGGRSSSSRVVFQADGSGHRTTGGEGYSAGAGGTFASQGRGGEPFRWQVRGGRLLVDQGAGLVDVNLDGKPNSDGAPILTAGGVEYRSCR